MNPTVPLKDVCRLATTVADRYGDKTVSIYTEIACLFLQSSGKTHSNNVDLVNSDAHVYLDIDNPEIKGKGYRLEGQYLIINPFGVSDADSWYRIERVVVGQRKLLTNEVNNVHAYLKKVAPLEVQNVS